MHADRIGFIGTGIMGGHMATRLAQAGFALRGWNRSPDKIRALEHEGVRAARTPADAAAGAGVVLCMLSSGAVCDAVLFDDPEGPVAAMTPGSTLVVMSSIPVDCARAQARRPAARGLGYPPASTASM